MMERKESAEIRSLEVELSDEELVTHTGRLIKDYIATLLQSKQFLEAMARDFFSYKADQILIHRDQVGFRVDRLDYKVVYQYKTGKQELLVSKSLPITWRRWGYEQVGLELGENRNGPYGEIYYSRSASGRMVCYRQSQTAVQKAEEFLANLKSRCLKSKSATTEKLVGSEN